MPLSAEEITAIRTQATCFQDDMWGTSLDNL